MDIPLSDPKRAVDEELIRTVTEVLRSGRYVHGERVKVFERDFSGFAGSRFSVALSSGTAALHTALMSCGVGRGDEVITTAHSFIASANAIVHSGARPVLVDIEPETMNIDTGKIEEKITEKTKAIMPVHLYGHPADMDPIMEIAEKHDLRVVEDACQAHGARYKGRGVGSIGDVGCFSFFPSKAMTVLGEGGILTTNNEEVAERAEMLRNQGRRPGEKYSHDVVGFNYRMSEISAAIGSEQLKRLPGWIESRRGVAKKYNDLLSGVNGVVAPVEKEWAYSTYYVYTIRVLGGMRKLVLDGLKGKGIGAGIYFPIPVSMQPAYKEYGFGSFPVSEKASGEVVSLPMHQFLREVDIRTVSEKVIELLKR
jgi:dTDP-4-amino-4,6-dideoxygalactose transaminase